MPALEMPVLRQRAQRRPKTAEQLLATRREAPTIPASSEIAGEPLWAHGEQLFGNLWGKCALSPP